MLLKFFIVCLKVYFSKFFFKLSRYSDNELRILKAIVCVMNLPGNRVGDMKRIKGEGRVLGRERRRRKNKSCFKWGGKREGARRTSFFLIV